jgi:hypothetical protein
MVWRTLGRLILIPIAAFIGGLAGGLVLVTLGLERFTQATHGRWQDGEFINNLIDMVFQGELPVSGLTLVPALAVVIIGEVARIRSMLFYVLGGGLALVAVPLLARYGETGSIAALPAAVWQVFATAGFVGGWVYWLLAGRNA